MKTKQLLALISLTMATSAPVWGGSLQLSFDPVEDFRDFSVSGLTEVRTLPLFESEILDELEGTANRYLEANETLIIHFTNIDMAGDIQPWRNHLNADIRYVESIYPPHLEFNYTILDGNGKTVDEGSVNITDLSFMMNVLAPMQSRQKNFFYEATLLKDWMRKTYRKRAEVAAK